MKKRTIVLLGVLMLAAIAWAAPGPIIDLVPRWAKAGLYLGPTASVATAAANRLTTTVTADIDYDFASSTIVCTDTPAHTTTGVKKGDPCFVGVGPRDGGTAIVTDNSVFMAIATADNAVKLRHCAVGTAANPVDAGYVVRCFSNQ